MFSIGLDLGQRHDPTPIAVVERIELAQAWQATELHSLRVRHLERAPLGTPYPGVVARVRLSFNQGIAETWTYNARLQPTVVQAGSFLTLMNYYDPGTTSPVGCSGSQVTVPGNNGNVLAQQVNGLARSYGYDGLNRLCFAGQGGTWTEAFSYDAFGNRAVTPSGLPPVTVESVASTAYYGTDNRVSGWG